MSALVLLTASSCQSDDKADGNAIAKMVDIEASVGTATRVTYNGNEAEFANGDAITLIRVPKDVTPDLVGNNTSTEKTTYTLAKGKWSSYPLMLWYEQYLETPYDFYAIYPALTSSSDISNMSITGNISSDDVMLAKKGNHTYSDGKVSLAFSHAMAKLVVNLSKLTNEVTNTDKLNVTVKNAKKQYSVSFSDMKVIAQGTYSDLQLAKQTNSSASQPSTSIIYSLLLPPQDGVTSITVNDGTKAYTWTNSSAISLLAGKVTTVTLNVGENYVLIGSVAVEDWTPSSIAGGEVEQKQN